MANAFVEACKATYADLKAIQDARVEAWAIGYEADEALYFSEIKPRVTFKQVMVDVAREWRARKAEARAEVEFWQAREAEFFAADFEPEVEREDATTAVFRTRNGALMFALLAARVCSYTVKGVMSKAVHRLAHTGRATYPKGVRMSTTSTVTRCKVTVTADDVCGVGPLTLCCNAAGTGAGDGSGILCKACYQHVADCFGSSGYRAIVEAVTLAGCPCAEDCAMHTLSVLEAI